MHVLTSGVTSMGFFKGLFSKDTLSQRDRIAAIEKTVAPFVEAALASVDQERFTGSPAMQRLAMAYVFGATAYLAEYDGLPEDVGRKLAGDLTGRRFSLTEAQVVELSQQLSRAPDRDPGRFFMIEGASALRRYVAFQDDSYARRLGKTLSQAISGQL